ncbi:hypothetical protein ACQ4PT_024046 [Festuca glaucescens]
MLVAFCNCVYLTRKQQNIFQGKFSANGLLRKSGLYNNILHPNKLGMGASLFCLDNKIEPKWEDPICANGRKWTISCGKGKSDTLWLHTLLPLIGGRFEYGNEICGAVLRVRGTRDMIAVKDSANEPAQ